MSQGRFLAGDRWIVPLAVSEFEAIWAIELTPLAFLARLDRNQRARKNAIRIAGMLEWVDYGIRFSPRDLGYWTWADRVVAEAADRHQYVEYCFFADAQRIVPHHTDRRAMVRDWADFVAAHPTVIPQIANEARKNGWREADDPLLLELADLFRMRAPGTCLSVSDPVDNDREGMDSPYVLRQGAIAPHADYLVVHPDRREDTSRRRFRRWLDHLKGTADRRRLWPADGIWIDEPMGAAAVRVLGRRDHSVVAHVAGVLIGAMVGGYTYHKRSEEDDTCPGLVESAMAADLPGSPDYHFVNATIGDSPVLAFTGYDKVRTMTNGRESYAVGYGRRAGEVTFRPELTVETLLYWRDDEGVVTCWHSSGGVP